VGIGFIDLKVTVVIGKKFRGLCRSKNVEENEETKNGEGDEKMMFICRINK
jgi:hypothetical protein